MTEDPDPANEDTPGDWELALPRLRARFPDAREGVLFCVFKLEQDPEASLRDFRDEAGLRGISLSGRSLHSAKVLLGMAEKAARRKRAGAPPPAPEPGTDEPPPRARDEEEGSIAASLEEQVVEAMQRFQGAATEEQQRLRNAIRTAVEVLQQALDETRRG